MSLVTVNKYISKMFDILTAFEFKNRLWIITAITSFIFTSVGFLFGAYIHPFLLLIFTSLPIYLVYLLQFKTQQYKRAIVYVLLWAVIISISIVSLTLISPSLASKAILSANSYNEEMFQWIITNQGAEGTPSIFVPIHLRNATVFSLLSLITEGFIALFFGAYQMNYMNYYVGILLLKVAHPTLNDYLIVSLLSWPVYAILRVFGFISIGIATTIPLASRMFKKPLDKKALIKYLTVGLILIVLDIIVKTLAAPYYQKLLNGLINLG